MNTDTKTELDALRTFFQKLVYKKAEATGEVTENKIANKITKPKPMSDINLRSIEEIVIPSKKREEILSEWRQIL